MRFVPTLLLTLLLSTLAGCGGGGSVDSRDAPAPVPTATPDNTIGDAADFTPNSFLAFLDNRVGLGAGSYKVVVGTAAAGATGSFTLRIRFDDGAEQSLSGVWEAGVSGGGRDEPFHAGNPEFEVELAKAGGLQIEVDSAENAVVFLVRGNQVLARADANDGAGSEKLEYQASSIDSRSFSDAYYATVDPMDMRKTLDGWKQANNFLSTESAAVANAVFRDAKDLGYGRDMYAWEHDCGIAIFEDNYLVQIEEGDASTYGPLNLDAAIERDRRYLAGSNAVEFGPPGGAISGLCEDRSKWVVSYYTFAPPDGSLDEDGQTCSAGEQCRRKEVNFDGRGTKFMPGVCVICHGGTLRPPAEGEVDFFGGTDLDFASAATHVSIKSTSLNVLNPGSLEFSEQPGFNFDVQRDNIAAINSLVRKVFTAQESRIDGTADTDNWSPTFASELVDGLMAVPVQANSNFVPAGWSEGSGAPAGAEALFKGVVEPYCVGCHAVRGNRLAEARGANAVNFSTYEKFIAYADTMTDYVFRQGSMPLSLISFSKFWADPDAPLLLANAIDLADAYRSSPGGAPQQPGRPVPKPGSDRVVFFPVLPENGERRRAIELDGTSSNYSTEFAWRVVTSPGGEVLANDGSAVAQLTVTQPGRYQLGLTTSNSEFGASEEAFANIEFTTDMLDDRETVLVQGGDLQESVTIERLFETASCVGCHAKTNAAADGGFPGLSMYFNQESYSDPADFHRAVLARVDLANPRQSRLLMKPLSGALRHVGSSGGPLLRDEPCSDTDQTCSSEDYERYQLLLGWISAGAPCGGDPDACDYARMETQAPLQPTELTVTEASRNGLRQSVNLAWRDNAVNETGFVIQRSTEPTFAVVEEIEDNRSNDWTADLTDNDIAASTSYYYRVAAENSAGRSVFSNTVSVTSLIPLSPAAPTLALTVLSDTEINLSWSQASDDVPSTGFEVFRRLASDSDFGAPIVSLGEGATTYNDQNLAPSTAYTYRICALGTGAAIPACSVPANGTTLAEPPPQPILILTVNSATVIDLEWSQGTGGDTAEYRIERRLSSADAFVELTTVVNTVNSFSDTGLLPNTTYEYRVCAVGSAGSDLVPVCSVDGVTATTPPVQPSINRTVVWSDGEIRVTWAPGASSGPAPQFSLESKIDGSSVFATVGGAGDLPAAGSTVEDTGLQPSTAYAYRICATGSAGGNPVCSAETSGSTVDAGAALWTGNGCSGCHGGTITTAGEINEPFVINIPVASRIAATIYDAVLNGRAAGAMPANLLPTDREPKVRAICNALQDSGDCDQIP